MINYILNYVIWVSNKRNTEKSVDYNIVKSSVQEVVLDLQFKGWAEFQ